ncbi:hypothetical protein [Leptospira kmetyi]|uniref:hypothetical protein n=1 Tax=Leptospira kmetyi TaxID=408139 RepID=UPI0014383125|nr:hypothetical protein [Leptospira kmetyi]
MKKVFFPTAEFASEYSYFPVCQKIPLFFEAGKPVLRKRFPENAGVPTLLKLDKAQHGTRADNSAEIVSK